MAIEAVGVELVEVPRFARVLERFGDRLLRHFSPDEIAYAKRKHSGEQNLAARFAAKCAGRRALIAAGGPRLPLAEFEVRRHKSGEPTLALREHSALNGRLVRLSLTHDADFAMASLWIEANESS